MTLLRYSGRGGQGGGQGGRWRGGRGGREFQNASTQSAVAAKKSNRWVRRTNVAFSHDDGDEKAETMNHINAADVNRAQQTAKSSNNNKVLSSPQENGGNEGENILVNEVSLAVLQKVDPLKSSVSGATSLRPKSQQTRLGSHAWKRTRADVSSKGHGDARTCLEAAKPIIGDDAGTISEAAKSSKSEELYAARETTFEAVESDSVAKAAPETISTNEPRLQQESLLLKSQSENNQIQYRVVDAKLAPSESADPSSPVHAASIDGTSEKSDDSFTTEATKNDVASYVSSRKGTSLRRPTATVGPSRGGSASSSTHEGATENNQRSVETKVSSRQKLGTHRNKWVRSSAEAMLASEAKKPPPLDNGKQETPSAKRKYTTGVVPPAASQYRHGHSISRRRPHHRRPPTAAPAPKRIKIASAANISKELSSSDHEFEEDCEVSKELAQNTGQHTQKQTENTGDSSQQQGKTNDDDVVAEKLTDFAYRETNIRRGKKTKSRGLVRVQPQAAPICPTFLRGLQCVDETCLKRHDVPQEYAMPICSFFQRQGMCLKESCRFRHIKVNPRATPCPSFELLGFCDDPNCTMMHTRPAAVKTNMTFERKSPNKKKL